MKFQSEFPNGWSEVEGFKNHFEFAEVVLPRMHIYVCYKYHLKMLFWWASLVVPIGSRGKLEVDGGSGK